MLDLATLTAEVVWLWVSKMVVEDEILGEEDMSDPMVVLGGGCVAVVEWLVVLKEDERLAGNR